LYKFGNQNKENEFSLKPETQNPTNKQFVNIFSSSSPSNWTAELVGAGPVDPVNNGDSVNEEQEGQQILLFIRMFHFQTFDASCL
jgi:hypothetical protein